MKSSITLLISVLLIFAPMQVSAALIVQTFQGSKDNIVTNKDIKGDIAPETQADLFLHFLGATVTGSKTKLHSSPGTVWNAQKFDTSLGTLNSVELTYTITDAEATGVGLVSGSCAAGTYFGLKGSCDISIDVGYVAFYGVELSNYEPEGPLAPGGLITAPVDIGLVRYLDVDDLFYFTAIDLEGKSITFNQFDLNNFMGLDTFTIEPIIYTGNTSTITCDPGDLSVVFGCEGATRAYYSADYRVDLRYDYTAVSVLPPVEVPAPGSFPLLAGGLFLLGIARRSLF